MMITRNELAARLRGAREAVGWTQDDVARRLELSRSSVAQMELGRRSVSSLELDRLARLYGRDIQDFFRSEFRPEESLIALFRAQAAGGDDDQLAEAVDRCIVLARELRRLEDALGIESPHLRAPAYPSTRLRSKWQAITEGERVAAEERRRLSLGALPLVDIPGLLESQGIRTALLKLPDDISGLTLMEPSLSFFAVANADQPPQRRRFSWVHEYAHVLFDRDVRGLVSRVSERENLVEARANAFAAAILLPEDGARELLADLGKGQASRERWDLFDETGVLSAESRSERGAQKVQLYDVVLLAHHFGTSRQAALYRLRNLRLISQADFEVLTQEEARGRGKAIEGLLGLPVVSEAKMGGEAPEDHVGRQEFASRFLALALEAYRRERITLGKLRELGELVGSKDTQIDELLEDLGLLEDDGEILIPESGG